MFVVAFKKKTNHCLRLLNQFKYAYHISSQKGRLQRSRLSFDFFYVSFGVHSISIEFNEKHVLEEMSCFY